MQERKDYVDLYRGILIILVVLGHYKGDLLHDVIFLFHMPLFFMLSGLADPLSIFENPVNHAPDSLCGLLTLRSGACKKRFFV